MKDFITILILKTLKAIIYPMLMCTSSIQVIQIIKWINFYVIGKSCP